MKNVHWVLDGPVMENSGDVGGDIQVGPAVSARFRSDDCPEARFQVTAYATAKTYAEMEEADPVCTHKSIVLERYGDGIARLAPLPEGHLACSFKPGTVDVQAQYEYRMNGEVDESGDYEADDTDLTTYEWVGSDVGYPADTLVEEVRLATRDAKRIIEDWVASVNTYLHWDGRTRPND